MDAATSNNMENSSKSIIMMKNIIGNNDISVKMNIRNSNLNAAVISSRYKSQSPCTITTPTTQNDRITSWKHYHCVKFKTCSTNIIRSSNIWMKRIRSQTLLAATNFLTILVIWIVLLTLGCFPIMTNCHNVNNREMYDIHHHHFQHQHRQHRSILESTLAGLLPDSSSPSSSSSSTSSLIKISKSPTKTSKKDQEDGKGTSKDAPIFVSEISNQTIALGRDVVFECLVDHLGSYKLAWLKIDSLDADKIKNGFGSNYGQSDPELISIQTQIMSKDTRFRVSHVNMKQWYLHLKQVKPSDKGWYMCQINTEPLISQAAFLDILIPPSIDYNATSSDVSVDERHRLSIRCRAVGHPPPTIIWRREDNKDINLGLYGGKRYSAKKVEGEFLNITQVTRGKYRCHFGPLITGHHQEFSYLIDSATFNSLTFEIDDMGAYLCIASNQVPPSVSKRIIVHVNFRPKIKVSNQLVGSTIGSDVQLECRCEASPKPTTSWIRYDGQVLQTSSTSSSSSGSGSTVPSKYNVREEHESYRTKMKLRIFNLDEKDFGSYKCVAKNTLGEKEGLVRLYEIAPPSTPYLLSSWPTYIYTYQGKQQQQNNQQHNDNNNHQNMFGDKNYNYNNDYNDYHQQQQTSSSSSWILSHPDSTTITIVLTMLIPSLLMLC